MESTKAAKVLYQFHGNTLLPVTARDAPQQQEYIRKTAVLLHCAYPTTTERPTVGLL